MDIVTAHAFLADLIGKYRSPLISKASWKPSIALSSGLMRQLWTSALTRTSHPVFIEVARQGRVIAVEPLPDKALGLKNTLAHRSHVFQGALGEKKPNKIHLAQGTPEESGFRERHYKRSAECRPTEIEVESPRSISVVGIYADATSSKSMLKERTDALRGDIFLDRLRPIVSVEFGHPAYSVLRSRGQRSVPFCSPPALYLARYFSESRPRPRNLVGDMRRATWDYFMIPNERSPSPDLLSASASHSAPPFSRAPPPPVLMPRPISSDGRKDHHSGLDRCNGCLATAAQTLAVATNPITMSQHPETAPMS